MRSPADGVTCTLLGRNGEADRQHSRRVYHTSTEKEEPAPRETRRVCSYSKSMSRPISAELERSGSGATRGDEGRARVVGAEPVHARRAGDAEDFGDLHLAVALGAVLCLRFAFFCRGDLRRTLSSHDFCPLRGRPTRRVSFIVKMPHRATSVHHRTSSTPYGIRTHVTAVRGRRPEPLDERGKFGD